MSIIFRKGKSVSLFLDDKWKITYGSFDVKNPVTLYVKIQTYLTPLNVTTDCGSVCSSIKNYHIPNDSIFDSRFIQKIQFASTKVKKNKQSCLVITLTVKQKNEVVPFNAIQPHVIDFANDLISKITSKWNFKYYLDGRKN